MRKFSILIQLRFIYVYMFIYLVIGYFYDSYLKHIGLYKFIETYFGISFFFILFLVLLDFCSYFIDTEKKTGDCQKEGMSETGEGDDEVQISSYKINKSW